MDTETSRARLSRLLDPNNTVVRLDPIRHAATAAGRILRLELAYWQAAARGDALTPLE
jgi:hypothetical protein